MIELNILNTRMARFRQRRAAVRIFVIYLGGLFLILLVLLAHLMGIRTQAAWIKNDILEIEAKMAEKQTLFAEVAAREREAARFLETMEFYLAEQKKRVLWTDHLACIGQKTPPGVWLSRLASHAPSGTGETATPRTLSVEGYLLPDLVDENAAIDAFVRDLDRDDTFSRVYLEGLRRGFRERHEVTAFTIRCELKEGDR